MDALCTIKSIRITLVIHFTICTMKSWSLAAYFAPECRQRDAEPNGGRNLIPHLQSELIVLNFAEHEPSNVSVVNILHDEVLNRSLLHSSSEVQHKPFDALVPLRLAVLQEEHLVFVLPAIVDLTQRQFLFELDRPIKVLVVRNALLQDVALEVARSS